AIESDRGQILRLASRLQRGPKAGRLLEARGLHAGSDNFLLIPLMHGAQESHAGKRLCAERDVPAWYYLFVVPRRARDRELRSTPKAHGADLPGLSRPLEPERPAYCHS